MSDPREQKKPFQLKPLNIVDDRKPSPQAADAREAVAAAFRIGRENTMVIGRLHVKDGFVAERTHDETRPIRIGLSHGGDPFSLHTPVVWCEFTESEFASLMAHVARRGETGETHREAMTFLQETGIEDDKKSA